MRRLGYGFPGRRLRTPVWRFGTTGWRLRSARLRVGRFEIARLLLRAGLTAGLLPVFNAFECAMWLAILRSLRLAFLPAFGLSLRRTGAVVAVFSFFTGQPEIHLLLEAVHLG